MLRMGIDSAFGSPYPAPPLDRPASVPGEAMPAHEGGHESSVTFVWRRTIGCHSHLSGDGHDLPALLGVRLVAGAAFPGAFRRFVRYGTDSSEPSGGGGPVRVPCTFLRVDVFEGWKNQRLGNLSRRQRPNFRRQTIPMRRVFQEWGRVSRYRNPCGSRPTRCREC